MTRHNLPPQPTTFIGRSTEIAEIVEVIHNPACRLLTLVGPGGIGKTRLALEVSAMMVDHYSDGVCFVPLQPFDDPENMISALAGTLKFQFYESADTKQQLLDFLCNKHMLLLMDNFEHLLAGAGFVIEILAVAPQIQILVTSREVLNLREEWLYQVEGMGHPQDHDMEAVQLFIERARQVRGDFSVDAERADVNRIVGLVEGMPLAIELVAAWVRSLSCDEIAREIENSLDLLSTTLHNVPERHRNMRVVFTYSWESLDETDREVFQKLSVFRESFKREAATQVANATVHSLSRLVDCSLLGTTTSGRYRLHELLRQFAAEKLGVYPDVQKTARSLHAEFYADFLYQRFHPLFTSQVNSVLDEIEQEIDNIRAAWQWSSMNGNLHNLLWSTETLWIFHELKNWYQDGEDIFSRAVATVSAHPKSKEQQITLGKLMSFQASFVVRIGGYERGQALLQASHEILSNFGSSQALGDTGQILAFAVLAQGEYEKALRYSQDSLDIFRELGASERIAWSLYGLSLVNNALARYEQAAQHAREAISIAREAGDVFSLAENLALYSQVMKNLGYYEETVSSAQETHSLASDLGNRQLAAWALVTLGETYFAQADYKQSRIFFHKALQTALDIRVVPLQLDALVGMAELLLRDDEITFAEELLIAIYNHPSCESRTRGRIEHLLNELRSGSQSSVPDDRVKTLNKVIEAIYELPQFARLDAVDTALGHAASPNGEFNLQDPLTQREHEILACIAQGLTNRQIADQLFIELSTVKRHISNCYSKLDVTSRTQAIIKAQKLKLV